MAGTQIKIAISGVSGQLGRTIAAEIIRAEDLMVTGGMVSSDSANLDTDLGELADKGFLGVSTVVSLEEAIRDAQILIDSSQPHVTAAIAPRLVELGGCAFITGVTGLNEDQQATVLKASESIPVLQASNFSLGVALVERLVGEAAQALKSSAYDLEIVEAHHKRKADSPSGTALSFGQAAAVARGARLDDLAQYGRPRTGANRPLGAIGFSAIRGGGIVGEHAARFISAFEEVTLSHRAFDRFIFAQGAVEAARWIKDKPAGLYTMQDVLM